MIITKYRFNSEIDTFPTFNTGYTYTYSDVDNGDGSITRTIESDTLPTSASFNGNLGITHVYLFNTTELTSMGYMFNRCENLQHVDFSHYRGEKVTNMTYMLYRCYALTYVDFSNFNAISLKDMSYMFCFDNELTSINFSNFNAQKIENLSRTFYTMNKIEYLDLSSFNGENLKITAYTFSGGYKWLDLSNFNLDPSKITDSGFMFQGVNSVKKIKLINCSPEAVSFMMNYLPTRKDTTKGYIFVRQECQNEKYWENVICQEDTVSISLPQPLMHEDKLYWDDNKKHYCIEQNIKDGLPLENPNIIDIPNLNEKYFYDIYFPKTNVRCENSTEQPSRILLQSDITRYVPTKLNPSTKYTIQFNCITNNNTIIFRIDNIDIEVQAKIGINKLTITTPDDITNNRLYIIGKNDKISEIMLIEGDIEQTPSYFDEKSSVGIKQNNGTYKIKITTNTEGNLKKQSFTIITNKPLDRNDKIYWDNDKNTYVIDRNGTIEIATIEEQIVNLPRLYQREDTYLNIDVDNIKPSKIKIQYRDIK